MNIEFFVYAIIANSDIIHAGVADDMNSDINISLPDHNFFVKCKLRQLNYFCKEYGLDFHHEQRMVTI